ncbi:MAG: hypothetical protein M0R68_03250 [Bacteroidetes bacterium]|nr:hypothetical protein [Bacteroidota bacterium]
MTKNISILCLLSILLTGCKDDINSNNLNAPHSNEIFPMAIGNKWAWNYSAYDSSGKSLSRWNTMMEIHKDTIVNGIRWFISGERVLFANLDTGFCLLDPSGIKLILKYPAKVNDSFRYLNDEYLYIVSIDTMISTALGNYHCYAYEARIPPDENRIGGSRSILFVSPGIGEVKSVVFTSTATNAKQYISLIAELVGVSIK